MSSLQVIQSEIHTKGVPFKQGVGFFKDLHCGEAVGLNKGILSPSVLFTFPSIYNFFPTKEIQRFVDSNKKEIEVDLFKVDSWISMKLSVFHS